MVQFILGRHKYSYTYNRYRIGIELKETEKLKLKLKSASPKECGKLVKKLVEKKLKGRIYK